MESKVLLKKDNLNAFVQGLSQIGLKADFCKKFTQIIQLLFKNLSKGLVHCIAFELSITNRDLHGDFNIIEVFNVRACESERFNL